MEYPVLEGFSYKWCLCTWKDKLNILYIFTSLPSEDSLLQPSFMLRAGSHDVTYTVKHWIEWQRLSKHCELALTSIFCSKIDVLVLPMPSIKECLLIIAYKACSRLNTPHAGGLTHTTQRIRPEHCCIGLQESGPSCWWQPKLESILGTASICLDASLLTLGPQLIVTEDTVRHWIEWQSLSKQCEVVLTSIS